MTHKKNTYLARDTESLSNGSFYRSTGRKKDAFARYVNGDFMSFTDELPEGMESWSRKEAKPHLPNCCK